MHGGRPLRSTRRLTNLTGQRPGWYRIENSAVTGQPTVVSLYDEIGFFAVSADEFVRDLAAVDGDIELHVNSPGGDIFDGLAIYNSLRQRKDAVSVVVDGLAASAASFIAMAASPGQLAMAPHSQMMIHDGFSLAIGNADDMRKMADLLEMQSDNIAGIYADRSGKPAAYWRDLMRQETWLTDRKAVAEGLADKVLGEDAPADRWDLSVFGRPVNADGNHAPMTGTHSHAHPAYGSQGDDGSHEHEHAHDGDADHGHAHDPDGDGDDDTTASGDTDHDYVLPDGRPGPKAGNRWHPHLSNADKYKQADRDEMARSGEAMPDGSYPIADEEDLDSAIRAVGRGGADHDAIRRHVIKRAEALGLSSRIPDNWNADGSLKDLSEKDILALFAGITSQLDAGRE